MNLQDTSAHAGHKVYVLEEGVTRYRVEHVHGQEVKISDPETHDVHEWILWCADCMTPLDPVDLGMAENHFDIV